MQEVVKSVVPDNINQFVDMVEAEMINSVKEGKLEYKVREPNHLFAPGIYSRELEMFPGDRITSQIHLTEHIFSISKGIVIVFENGKEMLLSAPYRAITKAGTRRVLWIPEWAVESCIWTTYHANPDNENIEQIENRILEHRVNPLLDEQDRKLIMDFSNKNKSQLNIT